MYMSTEILCNLSVIDRSCEKLSSITKSQGKKEHPTNNKMEEVRLDWSHLA